MDEDASTFGESEESFFVKNDVGAIGGNLGKLIFNESSNDGFGQLFCLCCNRCIVFPHFLLVLLFSLSSNFSFSLVVLVTKMNNFPPFFGRILTLIYNNTSGLPFCWIVSALSGFSLG